MKNRISKYFANGNKNLSDEEFKKQEAARNSKKEQELDEGDSCGVGYSDDCGGDAVGVGPCGSGEEDFGVKGRTVNAVIGCEEADFDLVVEDMQAQGWTVIGADKAKVDGRIVVQIRLTKETY